MIMNMWLYRAPVTRLCKHRTIQSVGIVKFVELIKKVATALDPAPLVVPISTNENAYSGTAN